MLKLLEPVRLAVIGGSGLYEMENLRDHREVRPVTPFGSPSDAIVVGLLQGTRVAFLPRHGRGHRINPSEINHRANLYALKILGVEQVISVSACGSLKEEIRPRDVVFPDQLFDRTQARPSTFFEKGIVAHVGFAHPYCAELSHRLYEAARPLGFSAHAGGTYVCIEGPCFSTQAESNVYRSMGFSVIGMTNLPEAKLAREAEMCYAAVALVTDYDVWREGEEVTVEQVLGNLRANSENVRRLLVAAIPPLVRERRCACARALRYAILTDPKKISPAVKRKLKPFVGKYLSPGSGPP